MFQERAKAISHYVMIMHFSLYNLWNEWILYLNMTGFCSKSMYLKWLKKRKRRGVLLFVIIKYCTGWGPLFFWADWAHSSSRVSFSIPLHAHIILLKEMKYETCRINVRDVDYVQELAFVCVFFSSLLQFWRKV